MPKVKLKLYQNTQYIVAPDFCPYSIRGLFGEPTMNVYEYPERFLPGFQMDIETDLVHPSLCAICKTCTFVAECTEMEELTQEEFESFTEYLTKSPKIGNSIIGQRQYLLKEDRLPIAIFISFTTFEEMFKQLPVSEARQQKIRSFFLLEEQPICFIMGCPVYVSRKLTKSAVQVVGEIEWR